MWRSRAGTQIEEPFATLPLDAYCEMMSRHAKEQYERRRGVFPHLAIPAIYKCMCCWNFWSSRVLREVRYVFNIIRSKADHGLLTN